MSDSPSNKDFFQILIIISLLNNKEESDGHMTASNNYKQIDDLWFKEKTIAVETDVPDGGSYAALTSDGDTFIESCINLIRKQLQADTQLEVTFDVKIYVPETEDDEGYNIYNTSSVFSTTPGSIHIDDFVIMTPERGDFVLGECP